MVIFPNTLLNYQGGINMCLQLLAPMNFNLTSHVIQEAPDVRQRSIGTLPTNRHGLEKTRPEHGLRCERLFWGMQYAKTLRGWRVLLQANN